MVLFAQSGQGAEKFVLLIFGFLGIILLILAASVCIKAFIGYVVAKRNGYQVGPCIAGAFVTSYLGSGALFVLIKLVSPSMRSLNRAPGTNLDLVITILTVATPPIVLAYIGARLTGKLMQLKTKTEDDGLFQLGAADEPIYAAVLADDAASP